MRKWYLLFRKVCWRLGLRSRSSSSLRENPWLAQYDIGEWSYGDPRVLSWGEGSRLSIGRFCSIGGNVTILLGGEHRKDWVSTYPFHRIFTGEDVCRNVASKGDITIGNDVWIGMDATILGGVDIGNGAIVAARAVITRPVPAYAIAAGNPARIVGSRFDPAIVAALERIQWWNWPIEKIHAELPLFSGGPVQDFVARHDAGGKSLTE